MGKHWRSSRLVFTFVPRCQWETLAMPLGASSCYFADAHSPWQRGQTQHGNASCANGCPKSTDLRRPAQEQPHRNLHVLNTRPRATLDWKSPNTVYAYSTRAGSWNSLR